MTDHVRPAAAADVNAMTELAGARREQYAGYQPVFWRPAANAEQLHRPYLARLVDDEDVITLVTGRRSGGRGCRGGWGGSRDRAGSGRGGAGRGPGGG